AGKFGSPGKSWSSANTERPKTEWPRLSASHSWGERTGKIQSFRFERGSTQRRSRPRHPTRQVVASACASRQSAAKRRDGFVTQCRRHKLNSPCERAKFTRFAYKTESWQEVVGPV